MNAEERLPAPRVMHPRWNRREAIAGPYCRPGSPCGLSPVSPDVQTTERRWSGLYGAAIATRVSPVGGSHNLARR